MPILPLVPILPTWPSGPYSAPGTYCASGTYCAQPPSSQDGDRQVPRAGPGAGRPDVGPIVPGYLFELCSAAELCQQGYPCSGATPGLGQRRWDELRDSPVGVHCGLLGVKNRADHGRLDVGGLYPHTARVGAGPGPPQQRPEVRRDREVDRRARSCHGADGRARRSGASACATTALACTARGPCRDVGISPAGSE
jgi:hypothetical protein